MRLYYCNNFCIHINLYTHCYSVHIIICMLNFMFCKLLFYHVCDLSQTRLFLGEDEDFPCCLSVSIHRTLSCIVAYTLFVSMLSCCSNGISCWMSTKYLSASDQKLGGRNSLGTRPPSLVFKHSHPKRLQHA